MASKNVTIVPVKLDSNTNQSTKTRKTIRPVCTIQSNKLKISFYPGVNNHVIESIMKGLNDHDS